MENILPHIVKQVSKELSELIKNPLEGVMLLVNEDDISDIQAIIEGPKSTPYNNGLFRIKLCLGKDFPQAPPKGFFLTKIFHPNVSSSGEICVNTLKKDWTPNLGLKHVLLVIKCLLIYPNPESALNEEAGKLLLEHYENYCARAKLYTEIYAQAANSSKNNIENSSSVVNTNVEDTFVNKRLAGEKRVLIDKKSAKINKEKKKTLKRL